MAYTLPSFRDYENPVFKDIVAGRFTHKLELLNSLMQEAPDAIVSGTETGDTVKIPEYDVISGDSVQLTTTTTTTINAITSFSDIAVWVQREKAWGAQQLTAMITGSDPLVEIANQLADYWAAELHASGVSLLTGVFASALASTHVYDDGDNTINNEGLARAKQKMGDNAEVLSNIVLNSKVATDYGIHIVGNFDGYGADVAKSGMFPSIMGMRPSVTDKLTPSSGVYTSYLGKPGAVIYKFRPRPELRYTDANIIQTPMFDMELSRDATTGGGQDRLITRTSYLVHVPGVQFDGTVTKNPTNTELATGTTWTKVQSNNQLIPVIKYKSK